MQYLLLLLTQTLSEEHCYAKYAARRNPCWISRLLVPPPLLHDFCEVLDSTDHPIRFSPVVGAMCRPPMSKINPLSVDSTAPETNGRNPSNRKHHVVYHISPPNASEKC